MLQSVYPLDGSQISWEIIGFRWITQSLAISALTEPNRQKSCRKKRFLGSDIAARNRRSLATFHRTLKSQCCQCSIAFSCLGDRCELWGTRCALQSQIAKIAAISLPPQEKPQMVFAKALQGKVKEIAGVF